MMIGYWPLGLVLLESGAPKFLWSEVVNIANYLVNKLSTMANRKKSPMEVFIGKKPKVSLLCIFGCEVHVHVLQENKKIRSKVHLSSR
jgi:hypothetical protein